MLLVFFQLGRLSDPGIWDPIWNICCSLIFSAPFALYVTLAQLVSPGSTELTAVSPREYVHRRIKGGTQPTTAPWWDLNSSVLILFSDMSFLCFGGVISNSPWCKRDISPYATCGKDNLLWWTFQPLLFQPYFSALSRLPWKCDVARLSTSIYKLYLIKMNRLYRQEKKKNNTTVLYELTSFPDLKLAVI